MKKALLAAVLVLAACSSSSKRANPSDEIGAERDAAIAAAANVFVTGCFTATTATVGTDLRATIAAGQPIAIEWLSPYELVTAGSLEFDWIIAPDGSGTLFHEYFTDNLDDCDGPNYCGWHKETYAAGELYSGGALTLSPAITDFSVCAYP